MLSSKRWWSTAILLLALAASACGSDAADEAGTPPKQSTDDPDAKAPAASRVFLVFADDVHPNVRMR